MPEQTCGGLSIGGDVGHPVLHAQMKRKLSVVRLDEDPRFVMSYVDLGGGRSLGRRGYEPSCRGTRCLGAGSGRRAGLRSGSGRGEPIDAGSPKVRPLLDGFGVSGAALPGRVVRRADRLDHRMGFFFGGRRPRRGPRCQRTRLGLDLSLGAGVTGRRRRTSAAGSHEPGRHQGGRRQEGCIGQRGDGALEPFAPQ